MAQKIIAIALEIVADEFGVVAVGDEADALGQERILDLDLFEADRALLAGDFGKAGDLVDQFALRDAAHAEDEFQRRAAGRERSTTAGSGSGWRRTIRRK